MHQILPTCPCHQDMDSFSHKNDTVIIPIKTQKKLIENFKP